MTQSNTSKTLVEEYAHWLREHSSTREVHGWQAVSVPLLDHTGDHLHFYMRHHDECLEFSDDGYIVSGLISSGLTLNTTRKARIEHIANQFGASLHDGALNLEAHPSQTSDAMNRYIQALIHVDALSQTVRSQNPICFSEDVASSLTEQHIHYTSDVSIQGKSLYSHHFDFVFQDSDSHPTLFAKAPAALNATALATILFAWEDVSGAKERKQARLLVFVDDRDQAVNEQALTGFARYDAQIMRYTEIPSKAPLLLAS